MAAVGAAVKGQEALHSFLMSWQEALCHMSMRHVDLPAATEQLRALREKYTAHLRELESAAAEVDAAGDEVPSEDVPADLLAKRDELKAQVDGKQKQLKVVIDKLRQLQDDICLLTCSTISVE